MEHAHWTTDSARCGFTPQFEGLEKLFKKYEPQGLEVIGFPCNQFMNQDPSDDDGIQNFCQKVRCTPVARAKYQNYGVSFPMMAKSDVNGDHTNEVFKFLKSEKSGFMGSSAISA